MTKIVIVSHSEDIANGTKALLEQMAGDVSILIQGGVEGKIGTSYDHIQEMINDLEDTIIEMSCNLDDMTPEEIGYAIEQLLL